ncbi:MAG: hypothetical protein WB783_20455 [Arenicellales bacterium]
MAYRIRKVSYCYVKLAQQAGQGIKVLEALDEANVNLVALTGFPTGGGKAQLDLVPEDVAALRRVARKQGWKLSTVKRGFLVQGDDQVGIGYRVLKRLADQKINVTAADAVTAGKGRFGMILWVKAKDYNRAARALNAK